jgi:peptidyl-prolyl cis-trans isomerase A (cyclophilin A)
MSTRDNFSNSEAPSMRSKISLSLLALTLFAATAARAEDDDPAHGKFTLEEATKGLAGSGPLTAKIETTLGTFTCELYEKQAPMTVANFVGLARGTRPWKDPKTNTWVKKPFYDGLIFHRVIPGFMIQGGDPLGTGVGKPGYSFGDEFSPDLTFD